MILTTFLNVCVALPKRFVPNTDKKLIHFWYFSEIFEHFWKITVWHMAVPRVYVRRGTTVWIGTYISLTHSLTNTGRTNIDFFIPLHNRPLRGKYTLGSSTVG